MPNKKIFQNDTEIKITTLTLRADKLLMTITWHKITVDRIVRIAVDLLNQTVLLTFTNAPIMVEGKRRFLLAGTKLPTFRTGFKVKDCIFYEIEGAWVADKIFDVVASQLAGVRDVKGNLVGAIYFVGSDAKCCRQLLISQGKTTCLTKIVDNEIGDIRYDPGTERLFALLFKDGIGAALLIREADDLSDPHDLMRLSEWQKVGPLLEPGILSLSRPIMKYDKMTFVANMPDGMLCELKIAECQKYLLIWGKPQKAELTVLGKLFGRVDVDVGYKLKDEDVEVIFEKSYGVPPFVL